MDCVDSYQHRVYEFDDVILDPVSPGLTALPILITRSLRLLLTFTLEWWQSLVSRTASVIGLLGLLGLLGF